jgi:hypothetical protein
MMQRPLWWAVLVVLTALAIAVPLARHETIPTRAARAPAPVASDVPPSAPSVLSPPSVPNLPSPPTPDASSSADANPPAVVGPSWPVSAKYVLHVGDSSLGFEQGLALEMGIRFKAAGVRYEAVTEIDAGLHTFATSKKLVELVRWKKPDVVLLTLGMNNLTVAKPDDYEVDVKSIVAQVGDRPCWWIGPLSISRPETGLIAMLARTTAPCGWTNSYDLDIERQSDHLHPTQPGASHWADAIWIALGAPTRQVAP